jgi:hypothetical protein
MPAMRVSNEIASTPVLHYADRYKPHLAMRRLSYQSSPEGWAYNAPSEMTITITAANMTKARLPLWQLAQPLTDYLPAESRAANSDLVLQLSGLAHKWREETKFTSSFTELVMHPSYQRIIGVGRAAVPFLLRELQSRPSHWFWALNAITGENPVPYEDRGNLDRMTAAWLDWGRREELIQ